MNRALNGFIKPGVWRALAGVVALGFSMEATLAAENSTASPRPGLPIASIQRTTPVDFEKEILPLLRTSCLACHNRTKAKAELVLETPADIRKGGESGPAVIPGKAAESLLFKVSAHQEKPFMPPKDNKVEAVDFGPEQLALLGLWIDQGATGEVRAEQPLQWQALAPGINPIFALALSPDGQLAACGRANQLSLYHLPSQRFVGHLTDSNLITSGLYSKPGIAHRDMVHALAFNHDGTLLASGDYRQVKLWRRQRTEQRIEFKADALATTTAMASSRDGKRVVTGHADGRVVAWHPESGLVQTQWMAHGSALHLVSLAPDDARVATVSDGHQISLWNATTGSAMGAVETPGGLQALAWLSDGRRLASAHEDGQLRVWQLPDGTGTNVTPIREWKAADGSIDALVAHPQNPRRLISGGRDGVIRVWDLDKGEVERKMEHGGPVTALAIRGDGRRLASAGSNSIVRIWNEAEGKLVVEFGGDQRLAAAVAQRERDLTFVRGETVYRKAALEEATKREKAEADFVAKALENRVAAERTLTEKQKAVLVAVEARAVAEKAPLELKAELNKAVEARERAEADARQADGEVAAARQRIDRATANATKATKAAQDLAAAIQADGGKTPALGDGKAVAELLAASAAELLDDSRKVAARFDLDAEPKRAAAQQAKARAEKLTAETTEKLKLIPDQLTAALKAQENAEKEAATAHATKRSSEDQLLANQRAARQASEAVPVAVNELKLAQEKESAEAGELQTARAAVKELQQPIRSMFFSADGSVIATAGARIRTQTWGAETGAAIEQSPMGPDTAGVVIFDDSGRLGYPGSNSLPVLTKTSETWSLSAVWGGDEAGAPMSGRINTLQFSADGQRLVTGSGDPTRGGELLLWDVASGRVLRNFTNAHSDVVLSVDFSPDGKFLASSAADRFLKVWDWQTGKMVRSFEGHTHHVLGVRWKRDTRLLASAGADKVIKLWNFVTGEQKRTIAGADKEVTSLNYIEATGELLVTSGDAQVRVVGEDGKTVRSFGGGTDFMQAAAVTPDGRWVIGGGQDSVLRLWDGRTAQLVKAFDP